MPLKMEIKIKTHHSTYEKDPFSSCLYILLLPPLQILKIYTMFNILSRLNSCNSPLVYSYSIFFKSSCRKFLLLLMSLLQLHFHVNKRYSHPSIFQKFVSKNFTHCSLIRNQPFTWFTCLDQYFLIVPALILSF